MTKEYLRKAKMTDCDLIYKWINDSEVRKNSFSTQAIPYESHRRWFEKKLADKNSNIYIYMIGKDAAGEIRIDYENGDGIISYLVSEEYRHQGHGVKMLKLIEDERQIKQDALVLKGEVKYSNVASVRCFEKCGYSRADKEEHIEFIKKMN